jgi:predicted acyl esterase
MTLLYVLEAKAQLNPVVDSIPMSDGRKLAADIYIPNGMTNGPVILIQTPYNRQLFRFSLPMGIGLNLNSSNYIFVITDWRGFYGSRNAAYAGSPDRGKDGYSTVEWIAGQSWSNGKVGTWGASALGKVQYQTAKTHPPHLVCINPLVAGPQFEYEEYYPGGALRTEYLEQLDQLGYGLSPLIMAHPYFDFTWVVSETSNSYPDSIAVPCFMIGGWYDHNVRLMMEFYDLIKQRSPSAVKDAHKLLMGPWEHGGKGNAKVGTSTQGQLSYPNAQSKNDSMSIQFFDYYLRGISNGWNNMPNITYYQMGENKWTNTASWPPTGSTMVEMFLHGEGKINTTKGGNDSTLNYQYDPQNPSPTIGGCTLRTDLDQGPYDQKPDVESRNDILIFSTDVLTEALVVKGVIKVHLKVSSDKLDTDFDIRLTDVYPDGRSMLLNDAVFRMRFREGFAVNNIKMMSSGTVYDCIIELPATCITFLPGHRMRLIVSSSNYPKYNRNMNNGGNMYPGNSLDSVLNPEVASNTVYMSAFNASKIVLPLYDYTSSIQSLSTELLKVWPNPSDNLLNIDISQFNSDCTITIRDLEGRVVMQFQGQDSNELDISTLAQGLYIIEVRDTFRSANVQFVKQSL